MPLSATTYPQSAIDTMLAVIKFDTQGLVPAIAQQHDSNEVLMMAWMDRDAVAETMRTGRVCYWSRSRKRLWHKGEESGHVQTVLSMAIDCDEDVLLLKVAQHGGIACHTGRHSCFYRGLEQDRWIELEPVLKDPATMYSKPKP